MLVSKIKPCIFHKEVQKRGLKRAFLVLVCVVFFSKQNCHWTTATPSNCGEVLKLQLPTQPGNRAGGQGNDPGYGKNVEDVQWTIRSQALRGASELLRVQFTD
jgi:hypothetical protein